MAQHYQIEDVAHPSIYLEEQQTSERKLSIQFTTPEIGVNEDTGILLLIAGFGGHSNSNVYKKMRDQFSDKYNLVVIQCDYFGYEFMQSLKTVNIPGAYSDSFKDYLARFFTVEEINEVYQDQFDVNRLIEIGKKYNMLLELEADLSNESLTSFNDMGLMQALDCIHAVIRTMAVLYDNGFIFNAKRVQIYGNSHGAYLAYLCNALAPTLFTDIIDNSAWIFPMYLHEGANRLETYVHDQMLIHTKYRYLAPKVIKDKYFMSLDSIYGEFTNKCNIIAFHGVDDELCSLKVKRKFMVSVPNSKINIVNGSLVDGICFKSTTHGLGADYLEFYSKVVQMNLLSNLKSEHFYLESNVCYQSKTHSYSVNYENMLPELTIKKR